MTMHRESLASVIWATRGRTWGSRFLLDGGWSDPLRTYEDAFSGIGGGMHTWQRNSEHVALRFADPELRRDASGRAILHEFVVAGDLADRIGSVDDGLQLVWPLVSATYEQIWDMDGPPTSEDVTRILEGGPAQGGS